MTTTTVLTTTSADPVHIAFECTMRRYRVALFLLNAAPDADELLDLFRAIARRFPGLTFADFVAATAIVETAGRDDGKSNGLAS